MSHRRRHRRAVPYASNGARSWALALLACIALLWSMALLGACGDNDLPSPDAAGEGVDAGPGPLPAVSACCYQLVGGRGAVQACLDHHTSPGDGCRWLTCDLVFFELSFTSCK